MESREEQRAGVVDAGVDVEDDRLRAHGAIVRPGGDNGPREALIANHVYTTSNGPLSCEHLAGGAGMEVSQGCET